MINESPNVNMMAAILKGYVKKCWSMNKIAIINRWDVINAVNWWPEVSLENMIVYSIFAKKLEN